MKQLTILIALLFAFSTHQASAQDREETETTTEETETDQPGEEAEENEENTTSKNRLLFLNAANFDFSGTLKVNYVGHINIFAPNLGKTRWAINTGIMKLNYIDRDTSKHRLTRENVAFRPLHADIDSGENYLQQFSKYKYEITSTSWSFYVQPMLELTNPDNTDKDICVFLHTHFELLSETWKITTTKTVIDEDTVMFDGGSNIYIDAYTEPEEHYNISRLNGYFGVGVTASILPWKNSSFFLQPTVGLTNFDNFVGLTSNNIPPRALMPSREWCGFYLVRAYYSQRINNAAEIILGTDIRGYFPTHAPNSATYLGLNLDVEKFLTLLGAEKGS